MDCLDLKEPATKAKLSYRNGFQAPQFLGFLVAGGLAAAVNFCSRIVLSLWMAFTPAIVLSYLLGMATAFVLFRVFIFTSSTRRLKHQLFWFVVVNAAALAQTIIVSLLLADYLLPALGLSFHTREIAHGCGVAVPILSSYFGHRWLSFGRTTG